MFWLKTGFTHNHQKHTQVIRTFSKFSKFSNYNPIENEYLKCLMVRELMSPVSSVFYTVVKVSFGLKNELRMGTSNL